MDERESAKEGISAIHDSVEKRKESEEWMKGGDGDKGGGNAEWT